MRENIISFALLIVALFTTTQAIAQPAGTYYQNADGKKGAELKTALCGIINRHTDVGYKGLLSLYHETDKRPDGYLWDMYSNITSFVIGGSAENHQYSKEGDGYNREHSVPQSWFDERTPMKSDAFHVVPTDGYVNNRRSNYPYGENTGATYKSNGGFSKVGTCTTTGYNGTVFEPNDEYKGDFARIYFYMVTCYENSCTSWTGGIFTSSKYPGLAKWQLDMLLRWAKNDPVSQKEIDRNNAVYASQQNRNPFVDYPGLEQYVWGSKVNEQFSYNDYIVPEGSESTGGNTGGEDNPGGEEDVDPIVPTGDYLVHEPFDDVTEGDSKATGGSSTAWSGNDHWASVSTCFQAGGAVRLGSGKSTGKIVSKSIPFAGGTLCVSLNVKGWTTVEGDLLVTLTGAGMQTVAYDAAMDDSFVTKTLTFENVSANPQLTIETSAKRAFVDNITVWDPSATTIHPTHADHCNSAFYSLSGQAYQSLPTVPGIYVHNGRKVVVK